MTTISHIDEHGISLNLKVRYQQDNIYVTFSNFFYIYLLIFYFISLNKKKQTYAGTILIAVNPYKILEVFSNVSKQFKP